MTTKGEVAAEFINRHMWIFHTAWFGYFAMEGMMWVLTMRKTK
jgi:hypothetical protein